MPDQVDRDAVVIKALCVTREFNAAMKALESIGVEPTVQVVQDRIRLKLDIEPEKETTSNG